MHYDTHAFSKNGNPTIIPKQNGVQIGKQQRLSPIDIIEVRQFYQCTE
jgi:astacin